MGPILIHSSSKQDTLQNQALRLQQELQVLGYHVEYSTLTHPARLLKKNYEALHILTETHQLNLMDQTLLLTARLRPTATIVSSFEYGPFQPNWFNRFQFQWIDAFSTTDLASLKSCKSLVKEKFILPPFPLVKNKILVSNSKTRTYILRLVHKNYNELLESGSPNDYPLIVDASSMAKNMGLAYARRQWRQFQNRHPQFKSAVVMLKFENVLDFFQSESLIVDLTNVSHSLQFHRYLELILTYRQLTQLNKNQATGFPQFWKHGVNCWISDFHEDQKNFNALIKKFFKSETGFSLSLEDKTNELSRIYTKLIYKKSLSYEAPA